MSHTGLMSKQQKQQLRMSIKQNSSEVYILSTVEFLKFWLYEMERQGKLTAQQAKEKWQEWKGEAKVGADYFAPGKDVVSLTKLVADLGVSGQKIIIKNYSGKPHVIIKGYPGLRKILTGTKYGISNPKIVQVGIGKLGAVNSAKAGGVLTIVLLTVYRVLDYFLTDSMTMTRLMGTLATDFVKVGLSTAAAVGMVTLVAGTAFATFAVGLLVVAIGVGLFTSWSLDTLDKHYQITERIISGLDALQKNMEYKMMQAQQKIIDIGKKAVNVAVDTVVDFAANEIKKYIVRSIHQLVWVRPNIR